MIGDLEGLNRYPNHMGLNIVLLMAIRCLRVTVPELLEVNICRLYLHIMKRKNMVPQKDFPECFLVMSTASLIYDKGDGQRFHPPECSHDCTSSGLKYGSKHLNHLISGGILWFMVDKVN